jgi:hypothetical protein
MREPRRAALSAEVADIWQRQAQPVQPARTSSAMPRSIIILALPASIGRRGLSDRSAAATSTNTASDRLLHLSPKAQVYAGQVKADQAEEHERVLDVMQAGLDYLPDAIGGAPANCRVSSRNLQIVGREYALPDQDAKLGPHRDEPPGSGLHHEAGDRDHWCRTASESNPGPSHG